MGEKRFMSFFNIIQENIHFFVLGFIIFSILLFILAVIAIIKVSKVKKRVNLFMGNNNSADFEDMLKDYLQQSKAIDDKQNRILDGINSLQNQIKFCIQKVSIIRYNPFDDVGGDLCYAIAILDQNNDGFVLNSVYSRDGCYTYAKPIERGICSKYKLSSEEQQAVSRAIENSNKR